MNFYSEDTINNIIDTEEIENIIPKIEKFTDKNFNKKNQMQQRM